MPGKTATITYCRATNTEKHRTLTDTWNQKATSSLFPIEFLKVPWVGLQSVIVAFPGHIHLRFRVFTRYTSCILYVLASTEVVARFLVGIV